MRDVLQTTVPGYNDGRDGPLGFDLSDLWRFLGSSAMPHIRCWCSGPVLRSVMMRHGSGASGPLWTKVKGEPYSTQIMIDEWSFGCKNSTDTGKVAQKMQGQNYYKDPACALIAFI